MELAPQVLWIGTETTSAPLDGRIHSIPAAADALHWATHSSPEVIIIGCPVAGACLGELLEELGRLHTSALILVDDPAASIADTVRFMRLGAHDVAGPEGNILALIETAMELQRGRREANHASAEPWRKLLIGSSPAIQRIVEVIRLVGGRRATVLVTGETGTGKEVIARALHLASPRATMPFIAVNCTALPESLLEAELFGHVKGAFTGAIHQRVGRFEQAHRGTLFLDEVGDLPLDAQSKLLRVLQEREFQRVGSSETIRVDVRLIAATNLNLLGCIKEGKFREDLYYRLNVVPLPAPPLREHPEDIPALAQHFVSKICRLEDIPEPRLTPEVLSRLQDYSWPGNVRQLENAVEMAVAMSGNRSMLCPSDFGLAAETLPRTTINRSIAVPETGLNFDRTIGSIERQVLEDALRKTHGNKTAAAGILGLKRTTLAAKLKSLEAAAG